MDSAQIKQVEAQMRAEFAAFMEELDGDLAMQRVQVEAAFDEVRRSASAAIEARDWAHLRKLQHEIPVILQNAGLTIRAQNRDRVVTIGSSFLGKLISVVAKAITPAMLVFVLLVGAGCTMRRGYTTTAPNRNLVNNLCEVTSDCVRNGWLVAAPQDCRYDVPVSLVAQLREEKLVHGSTLASGVGNICAAVDSCLGAAGEKIPDYRRTDYVRWCDRMKTTASILLNE